MLLGVLAGLPAAALIILASRRVAPDYSDNDQPARAVTYADEVTPYTHAFRRLAEIPALPDRQATIAELEAYLAHLKKQDSLQPDPRRFVVRWGGE